MLEFKNADLCAKVRYDVGRAHEEPWVAFAVLGIAVSNANGSPVENLVFKYPGFHENAPLLPGGGQRFFDSMSDSIGFNLKPAEGAGKFKVRLAPGSIVSVEAPGRGQVLCEADRILKERAVVLE